MKKRIFISTMFFILMMGVIVSGAKAATIDLFDWAFNVNGTVYPSSGGPGSLPVTFNDSSFNWTTGLGTLSVSGFGAGSNTFYSFFDHEIDQTTNGFTDEYGAANGAPSAGQSWEIDEPGFSFGDIYTNVTTGIGSLDNSNAVPSGSPEDVSMALGWAFLLGAGDTAVVNLRIAETLPPGGFYLSQSDPAGGNIYFSGDVAVTHHPVGVPEPSTVIMTLSGVAGLIALSLRSRNIRKSTKVA